MQMAEQARSSSSGQLLRFLSDPKDFSGSPTQDAENKVNPLGWLKKLNRLKDLIKLTDNQILIIASDHLVGKAGTWFDIVGSKATTWSDFTTSFKKKYCAGLEDVYWGQIKDLKQRPDESVEDVDVRLRELYTLVSVEDEKMMIRSFMDAIHPRIAYEVERGSELQTFSRKLEDLVNIATRVEQVGLKYQERGVDSLSIISNQSRNNVVPQDNPIADNPGVAHSDSDTINELLREFKELKINLVNTPRNYSPSRTLTCFHCNEVGHKKPECPKLMNSQPKSTFTPATGSNAVPIGSTSAISHIEVTGKDMEYHQ